MLYSMSKTIQFFEILGRGLCPNILKGGSCSVDNATRLLETIQDDLKKTHHATCPKKDKNCKYCNSLVSLPLSPERLSIAAMQHSYDSLGGCVDNDNLFWKMKMSDICYFKKDLTIMIGNIALRASKRGATVASIYLSSHVGKRLFTLMTVIMPKTTPIGIGLSREISGMFHHGK